MSPTLRALLLAAATAGAAAFAPYTGPTLETIDQEFCGDIGPCQRIVGSKKPGPAPAVVLLPYSETQFDVTLGILKPTMDKIAEQGYSVALIGPDYYDYPDRAGEPLLPNIPAAAAAVLGNWTEVAVAAYDTIKDGFCKIDDVDCSKIAVAGFTESLCITHRFHRDTCRNEGWRARRIRRSVGPSWLQNPSQSAKVASSLRKNRFGGLGMNFGRFLADGVR